MIWWFLIYVGGVGVVLSGWGHTWFGWQRDDFVHPVWLTFWVTAGCIFAGIDQPELVAAYTAGSLLTVALLGIVFPQFRPQLELGSGVRLKSHDRSFSLRRLFLRVVVVEALLLSFWIGAVVFR